MLNANRALGSQGPITENKVDDCSRIEEDHRQISLETWPKAKLRVLVLLRWSTTPRDFRSQGMATGSTEVILRAEYTIVGS